MATTEELQKWASAQKCLRAVDALRKHAFTAEFFETVADARDYILSHASDAQTIGFGGSMTIAALNLQEPLREQGKTILNHSAPGLTPEQKLEVMRAQLTSDLFLSGCNAITLNGELINIDATGNRVAAMIFGPRRVILVAGRNKLVDGSIEQAMLRVHQSATPPNAKRLSFNTPCCSTGFCSDCNAPDRLCRVTTVIDRRPRLTDVHVILINEDLGF